MNINNTDCGYVIIKFDWCYDSLVLQIRPVSDSD